MSTGPARVFSGSKDTLGIERISLGAKMLEMTESLKSWVCITPGRQHAPLSGVFVQSRFIEEVIEVLQHGGGEYTSGSEPTDGSELTGDDIVTLQLR